MKKILVQHVSKNSFFGCFFRIPYPSLLRCDSCGKAFSQKANLRRHFERNHAPRNTHSCETCGKSYFDPYEVKRHMKTVHTDIRERPQCDSCGKTFSQKVSLNQHLKNVHKISI